MLPGKASSLDHAGLGTPRMKVEGTKNKTVRLRFDHPEQAVAHDAEEEPHPGIIFMTPEEFRQCISGWGG
jgi:hypothetical protein